LIAIVTVDGMREAKNIVCVVTKVPEQAQFN